SGFDPYVQKIFRAMKTYGLIVADNGTDMYIGGTWDDRWDNGVLNPAFNPLTAADFEVVQLSWQPPLASELSVDTRAGGSSNQNGVFEPGETVVVDPSWQGNGSTSPLTSTASGFGGPPGATYSIADASAAYGTPAAGQAADCFDATGDCFALSLSNPATRPSAHWDAAFTETVNGAVLKTWTLHVGKSFGDVPATDPFYEDVETLLHDGITAGCGGVSYCPNASVTRSQMAVFVLKSKLGALYVPPAGSGAVFADVPPGAFALDWIEDLAASGISAGCGGSNFCPSVPVTRSQMAVFLLKGKHGSLYAPPAAAGIFPDVPVSSPFAPWIEELYNEGITAGCGGGNFCPDMPNTRAQMAAFLKTTFGLKLYEP
ncbi:MAG TPA: S-layer homology domain-containing protein, partial [Thermoanaerobaculia bacterium]